MLGEFEWALLGMISHEEAGEGTPLHLKFSSLMVMVVPCHRPDERPHYLGSSSDDGWHAISSASVYCCLGIGSVNVSHLYFPVTA